MEQIAERSRRLLTVDEAAGYLGMGRTWMIEKNKQGEIPVVRLGRAVRIDIADLDRWIEQQKAKQEAA